MKLNILVVIVAFFSLPFDSPGQPSELFDLVPQFDQRSDVLSAGITPDNKHIITLSADSTIRIWILKTGTLVRERKEKDGLLNSMDVSPDGKTIVYGSKDHSIKVLETETGFLKHTLKTYERGFSVRETDYSPIRFMPDGQHFLSGDKFGRILIWSSSDAKIAAISEEYGQISSMDVSPDGKYIVTARMGKITIWNYKDRSLIKDIKEAYHRFDYGISLKISSDGKYIVASGNERIIRIWNLPEGNLVRSFPERREDINDLVISPDCRHIITGGNGVVCILDIESGKQIRKFRAHNAEIRSLAMTTDGRYLVSAGSEEAISVWDLRNDELISQVEFFQEVRAGDYDRVATLLPGVNLAYRDKHGETALYHAVKNNLNDIVQLLLNTGAQVNLNNLQGLSPLMYAANNGNQELVAMLLAQGADISARDNNGWTASMLAACRGHQRPLELLLKSASNAKKRKRECTEALVAAAQFGQVEVVTYLLACGADANYLSDSGQSALMAASEKENLEIVKLLLNSGAKINLRNKHGWNAVMLAAAGNKKEMTEFLFRNGGDVDKKSGWTRLMAFSAVGSTDSVRKYIETDNLHAATSDQNTALLFASAYGHHDVVKMLLAAGARADVKNNNGDSPLLFAAEKGYTEIVKMLLRNGASCDGQNRSGDTPLHLAAYNNHIQIMKLLLESGANVALTDTAGYNALMRAVENGQPEAVILLLGQAIDLGVKNGEGRTALEIARHKTDKRMVQLLRHPVAFRKRLNTSGNACAVEVSGNKLYVLNDNSVFQVYEFSDSDSPVLISDIQVDGMPSSAGAGIDIEGNFAFLAAGSGRLWVIDISDPELLRIAGSAGQGGNAHFSDVSVHETRAYVTDEESVFIFDVLQPQAPRLQLYHNHYGACVVNHCDHAYYIRQDAGDQLFAIDISENSDDFGAELRSNYRFTDIFNPHQGVLTPDKILFADEKGVLEIDREDVLKFFNLKWDIYQWRDSKGLIVDPSHYYRLRVLDESDVIGRLYYHDPYVYVTDRKGFYILDSVTLKEVVYVQSKGFADTICDMSFSGTSLCLACGADGIIVLRFIKPK